MDDCLHKRYVEDVHGYCPDCGEIKPSVSHRCEARIAELKLANDIWRRDCAALQAENQRLRDALESIDESTHDVHAARKARKALLGGGG